MSEKKLFCLMSIEGILLLILGLCILIIPKLTALSFIVMVSSALIVYGIYKFIVSIINKNILNHSICEMLLGIYIIVIGILFLLVPKVNILWLIALLGIYFIIESILSFSFAEQIRSIFKSWHCKFFAAFILFLIGLFIILNLPEIVFTTVAILTGTCFVIKGMVKNTFSIANKNNYNEEKEIFNKE